MYGSKTVQVGGYQKTEVMQQVWHIGLPLSVCEQ